jgi:cysteinyl-tRNA synthetase
MPTDAPASEITKPYEEKFVAAMDDDFNTAGAIGAMHECAGVINAEIEKTGVENAKDPAALARVTAATARLKQLAGVLGLTFAPQKKQDDGLSEQLMQLIIELRATARKDKNFAMADAIRNGLTKIGVTLEDKKEGTIWRKN